MLLLEAVRERRRGRLVQETQDFDPSEPAGVLRRLALRVVEVSGDGDYGAADAEELVLRQPDQRAEDLGAHLHRRHDPLGSRPGRHAKADDVHLARPRRQKLVRAEAPGLRVIRAATHEALRARDRVARALGRAAPGLFSNDGATRRIGNDARQEHVLVAVGDGDRPLVLHVCDERVGRTQIDADRARRGFGVKNVEQRHDV